MIYTKEQIQEKLMTNQNWIERGLIVLYNRQTKEEQDGGRTIKHNERGFNGSDDRYLTYCSKWILKGNRLSGHHVVKCGKRLGKYWRQIQEEIVRKEQRTTGD